MSFLTPNFLPAAPAKMSILDITYAAYLLSQSNLGSLTNVTYYNSSGIANTQTTTISLSNYYQKYFFPIGYGIKLPTPAGITFIAPQGIAVDSNLNVYVCNYVPNNIIRIARDGTGSIYSTLPAGPRSITIDSSNNLFVTLSENHTIYKIPTTGIATLFAGRSATTGTTDGNATNARFFTPQGITIDGSDIVYITDQGSGKVRKMTPAGDVTTIYSATYSPAFITSIAIDQSSNLYISDYSRSFIFKLTYPSYTFTNYAGSNGLNGYQDGVNTNARFNTIYGLTIDTFGNLYACDATNFALRTISPGQTVSTLSGKGFGTNITTYTNQPGYMGIDKFNIIYMTNGNDIIRIAT